MPEVTQKVTLLRHTLSPEEVVALGARLCYSRATLTDLEQRIAAKDQRAFVEKLLDMGHESVLEHASFTFGVEGVSRVLLAQLTRHRLASFSVQSQRYVSYEKGFGYIVPPKIAALGPEAQAEYQAQMAQMHAWYVAWQEKLGQGGRQQRGCPLCAPRCMRNPPDGHDECAGVAALLRPAHVPPGPVGDPRPGHGDAPPVHGGRPGPVRRRGRALHLRPLPRRRKVLRTHAGNAPGTPGAAGRLAG